MEQNNNINIDTDSDAEQSPKPGYRRRGVYLLPNLFTTAAIFAGFYAIVASMNGRFEQASIAVFIAMILDAIDGRVARATNTQSEFGAQYDSLSDMVSFGLAPALIMYQWSLASMVNMGGQWGKMGWLASFIYTACAALRLARFNTQIGVSDKRYFQGLPSPSAAAAVVGMVWVGFDMGIQGPDVAIPALVLTTLVGILMVSNVLYYSFKEVNFKHKVPILTILVFVLALAFASIDPPTVLFGVFIIYILSGPILSVVRRLKKLVRRNTA
ncbi:MAG: CDP-diacylglycerol--serine O-phosphatidyltransferase [Gammaproteobacteria bacterium]|nr:CDP-diacylglycerol--serine O-phosphatidyltransferase [Gammaproteobacteria bacterium]